MKKVKDQLKAISKNLASLSKQVDRLTKQVDKPQPAKKRAVKKAAVKKTAVKKAAPKKKAAPRGRKPATGSTVLDTVYDVIKRSRKGVTIATLKEKSGLDARQLSNALYKLSKKGIIKTVSRGVYVKK
jgi:predicted Rossmann fold nucleotide-binding protein DprA/Smf involved in DNA uptake